MNTENYDIITQDNINPRLSSPNSEFDLPFYQTKETLADPEKYRSFIKNAERRFRHSKEYKMYKSYLMSLGLDHCQIYGNIESSTETGRQVDIELHHNILSLEDISIMITEHVLNTYGMICTFDLIQLLIEEHKANRVGVVFLSTTVHEMFTNNPEAYIPPNMTFGRWWELLAKYKYGITFEIAQKINKYINKYQLQMPPNVIIPRQEEIFNYAYYNQYGIPTENIKMISTNEQFIGIE